MSILNKNKYSKKAIKLHAKNKMKTYNFMDNIITEKPYRSAKLCNKMMNQIEAETGLSVDVCEAVNGLRIKLAESNFC